MKIFKRKNKEIKVVKKENPIDYIKKEKNKHFFITTSFHLPKFNFSKKQKKVLKITSLVALPVLAISLGTTLGIIASINQNKGNITNDVVINNNVSKRRVYLISNDLYTVPLTVSLEKKNEIHEEMLDVINLLKVSSKASNEYIHGFIKDDARVNSFTTNEENNLTIDFSKDFLTDDNINSSLKYDALVSTLLQFDNLNSVSLSCDGELIKENINKPQLNVVMDNSSIVENKELVTIFYQRNYDQNNKYLVPVSVYSNVGESDNITFANSLNKLLPSKYMLNNLDIYNEINKEQEANTEFNLNVNKSALIDEETVNKELYEIVMLSLDLMNKEPKVNFLLEVVLMLILVMLYRVHQIIIQVKFLLLIMRLKWKNYILIIMI